MSDTSTKTDVTSFSKALVLGEIHEDLVFPYPVPGDEEAEKVRGLIQGFRAYAADHLDARRIDEEGWIEDQVYRDLGELGITGLYVPEEYGGQGLSQTGYARVFEAVGQVSGSLTIGLGVHQSIGFKGIALYGTDEQRERFLPDLAAGRRLAGFALTEPNAGSDAYNIESRAVRQPDGSWVLNGEKRYIGNAGRGDVFTVFARAEVDGKDGHIALILEKGMDGFESGERYETMGLRGNDLRPLYFRDVRVPPENVLGEPGQGFRIAMEVLNNGRIGLGTGTVGLAKRLIDLSIDHVKTRRQFGKRAGRLRHGRGQDRLDGLLPLRPGVDGLPDDRADRQRDRRLLGRVRDGQGHGDRVRLVPGQPGDAAQGRRGLHAHGAL